MGEGSGRIFLFQFVTTPCVRSGSRLLLKSGGKAIRQDLISNCQSELPPHPNPNGEFMSFFKHVQLHEYDITDAGITSACYDELVADGNNSDPKQLTILARAMCEEFKDYMRPLFS